MKTNRMKKFSVITFILTLLISGGIFAYWADSVLGNQKEATTAIIIGSGEASTTTISLQEVSKTQGKLVPSGFKKDNTETEEVLIKFQVFLLADQANANGAQANLVVTILETGNSLIVAEILSHEPNIEAGGTSVEVTVKVTLDEPSNKDEYDKVANKNFEIKVQFEALI